MGHWLSSGLSSEPCLFSGQRIHGGYRGQSFTSNPYYHAEELVAETVCLTALLQNRWSDQTTTISDYCCYFSPFPADTLNMCLQSVWILSIVKAQNVCDNTNSPWKTFLKVQCVISTSSKCIAKIMKSRFPQRYNNNTASQFLLII